MPSQASIGQWIRRIKCACWGSSPGHTHGGLVGYRYITCAVGMCLPAFDIQLKLEGTELSIYIYIYSKHVHTFSNMWSSAPTPLIHFALLQYGLKPNAIRTHHIDITNTTLASVAARRVFHFWDRMLITSSKTPRPEIEPRPSA